MWGSSRFDAILSLRIKNPFLLGPYVGALTLAVIRSKLLDLKDAPFGLEYFYAEGRLRALISGTNNWSDYRDQFTKVNKDTAFKDADFFKQITFYS